jgi:hypothetical protein
MPLYLIFCESAFSRRLLRTKNHASLQLISDKIQIIRFYLSEVRSIRRKRGQIICLQGNNKSMVIFVLKRRKVVRQAV